MVKEPKVTKILTFNSEFFQVLPVSFETPPAASTQNYTACCHYFHVGTITLLRQGKMKIHSIVIILILVLTCAYGNLAIDIKPELKNNVLNFGDMELVSDMKACYIILLTDFMW